MKKITLLVATSDPAVESWVEANIKKEHKRISQERITHGVYEDDQAILREGKIADVVNVLIQDILNRDLDYFEGGSEIGNLRVILSALVSLKKRGTLVVNKPESFLHQRTQMVLTDKMIDFACQFDLRVVLDTASDLIVDAVRIAVADGRLKTEEVDIFFLDGNETTHILVREDGDFKRADPQEYNFPSGFMDWHWGNAATLAELRKKGKPR